jgi:cation:H+ antiporter
VNTAVLRRDGTAMAGAALVCLAAVLAGHVGREAGAVLCSLLLLYLVLVHRQQRRGPAAESSPETLIPGPRLNRIGTALGTFVAGLGLTVIGADLLVGAAIELARAWSVSDTVIGVTIVAVGTSLPELVTSVTAAVRNQADIAFGNIVGSNIFNVLGILGVTALVHPLTVPAEIANLDVWVMLGATALLLACAARGRLTRRHGMAFLLIYAGYLGIVLV